MSNNEILSPTETERQPFRQNQNGSGEKLKQPESPTRPSKISFRDVPSPPKSRNNAEEKPQVSLSDIGMLV